MTEVVVCVQGGFGLGCSVLGWRVEVVREGYDFTAGC